MRQVTEKLLKLEKETLERINSLKNEIKFRKEALNSFQSDLKDAQEALSVLQSVLESQSDVDSVRKQLISEAEEHKKSLQDALKSLNNKSKLSIIFKGGGWASQDLKRAKERRKLNEAF